MVEKIIAMILAMVMVSGCGAEVCQQKRAYIKEYLGQESFANNTTKYTVNPEDVAFSTHTYKTAYGEEVKVDIAMPLNSQYEKPPVLVYYHGGGYVGGERAEGMNMFVGDGTIRYQIMSKYSNEGYTIVSADYTLANKKKGTTIEDSWTDGKDSIRWLRKNADILGIDGENIGVMGTSAGGGIATMIGYTDDNMFLGKKDLQAYSSSVNFVLNLWGAAHYNTEPINIFELESLEDVLVSSMIGQKNNQDNLFRIGLEQDADLETIQSRVLQLTPTTYLNEGDAPTISFYGDKDTTTHLSQGIYVEEVLTELGIDNELHVCKNNGHGLTRLTDTEIIEYTDMSFEFGHSHNNGLTEIEVEMVEVNSNAQKLELNFTKAPINLGKIDAKFAENIAYDKYDKTKFDIFMPNSNNPTGLVIYIHGGGFKTGDKTKLYSSVGDQQTIRNLLEENIAVATINYRFVTENDEQGLLKSLNDSKRALQFIRYNNESFNIRKEDIALMGSSAGAGTSLWIATKDDMKDEYNSDPVLRESTRVKGIAVSGVQATYDFLKWGTDVFDEFELGLDKMIELSNTSNEMPMYGTVSMEDFYSPETIEYRENVDMLSFITVDDPEIWASSTGISNGIPTIQSERNHHPYHVKAIKEKADDVGLEMICEYGKPMLYRDDNFESRTTFLIRKVNE